MIDLSASVESGSGLTARSWRLSTGAEGPTGLTFVDLLRGNKGGQRRMNIEYRMYRYGRKVGQSSYCHSDVVENKTDSSIKVDLIMSALQGQLQLGSAVLALASVTDIFYRKCHGLQGWASSTLL